MKEIDQMNTEELRNALSEEIVKNESLTNEINDVKEQLSAAQKDSEQYRGWWNEAQDEKDEVNAKLLALKAIVNAL